MNVTIIGAGNMGRGIAFSGTLVEGQVAGQPLDVFIAGDEEEAKETVAQLVRDGGVAGHRRRSSGACEAAGGPRVPGDRAAAAAGVALPERLEAHKLGNPRIHQNRPLDKEQQYYALHPSG